MKIINVLGNEYPKAIPRRLDALIPFFHPVTNANLY